MSTEVPSLIRRTIVRGDDPRQLAAALAQGLAPGDAAAIAFFATPGLDRDGFAAALREHFPGVPAIGCTTAGELGPEGMTEHSVSAFSLPKAGFRVATARVCSLAQFTLSSAAEVVARLRGSIEAQGATFAPERMFAMLLVDGLSVREEALASSLHAALGDVPLFGGSAGDGLRFEATHVYAEDGFASNAAALMVVHTEHPFRVFKTQHISGTDQKLIVTAADAERRVVHELDGEPAAERYARLVGVRADELTPEVFAEHPVVVRLGGQQFVRSIQKAEPDGSLTFYCAIEDGIVLSLAQLGDLAGSLDRELAALEAQIGPPELIVGCDCILRRLEVDRLGLRDRVSALLERHRVVGFSTYGEQIQGLHVNQTFTGVAIGSLPKAA
ncbi:MAG: nitric oxide-sensing protein NosP [Candidatus Eisenbacteria bacterium]